MPEVTLEQLKGAMDFCHYLRGRVEAAKLLGLWEGYLTEHKINQQEDKAA